MLLRPVFKHQQLLESAGSSGERLALARKLQ
jgi:hypothetical protein